jgi:hypothetical protein
LKKSTGSVWFWFYKLETKKPNQTQTKKTEKNRAQTEKPSQTGKIEQNLKNKPKNRVKPVRIFFSKKSSQAETGRFELVSVFFKFRFGYLFLIKTKTNKK